MPPQIDGRDERIVIPLQLGRFKDGQGQTLQDRFEQWGRDAADRLMTPNRAGEPIFEAGKDSAELTIKVNVTRLSDDSASFVTTCEIKSKFPFVPFNARTTALSSDHGFIERATVEELSLFDPAGGQPEVLPAAQTTINEPAEA